MRKVVLLFIFPLLIFSAGFSQASKKDIKQIQKCFERYKTALLNQNGRIAIEQLNQATLHYYVKVLHWALHADSGEVAELGILDKMSVLTARARIPAEELKKMDGTTFLVYSVNQGMIGKNSVAGAELGEISVGESSAKADIFSNGKKSHFPYLFNKENNKWKVNLVGFMVPMGPALESMLTERQIGEDEFIIMSLKNLTGEIPGPEIWQPVIPPTPSDPN